MYNSDELVKCQEHIERDEWILYEWVEVTETSHTKRHYKRGIERKISDMENAARQWDFYFKIYRGVLDKLIKAGEA